MTSKAGDFTVRTEVRPGDLGMIVYQHGMIYAADYGLDATFEPYVAKALAEFRMPRTESDYAYHASPGRIWIAEREGVFAGSIAICRTHRSREAQLRWFLVMPQTRGTGLGPRLLDEAMAYCRSGELRDVYLWTFDRLHAAMKLYARAGFVETARSTQVQWGQSITEVRMDLEVA
jgi:GNAT superfamily N-acetyltransferase